MDNSANGQVALLVDFEKLATAEDINCEVLITFAEEHGRVLIANAYADWSDFSYRAYQCDLYRFGIDLIQVMAGSQDKKTVDIKLAEDAIDLVRTMPHINVFVIVSGDRDFIHLYEVLRSKGKTIISMSPQVYYQPNLAKYCDSYVQYEYTAGVQSRVQKITKLSKSDTPADKLLAKINKELGNFSQNTYQRRKILQVIFAAINNHKSFNFESVCAYVAKDIPNRSVVYSHLMGAYNGNCFAKQGSSRDLPPEKQQLTIRKNIYSKFFFIRAYEIYVASILRKLVDNEQEFSTSLLAEILGLLENEDSSISSYCQSLLSQVVEEEDDPVAVLLRKLSKSDGFCQDADQRRDTLKLIFAAITQQRSFRFDDIYDRIKKMDIANKPLNNVVQGYLKGAYYGQCFRRPASPSDLPPEKQQLSLKGQINTEDAFIRAYEQQSVAFTLHKLLGNEQELSASLLAEILGLPKDEKELAYCQSLCDALATEEDDDSIAALLRKLNRSLDGFCQDADERRNILKLIFAAITQQHFFRFDEISDRIEKIDIENKPLYHVVQSYLKNAYYGRCFEQSASQEELPAEERQWSLKEKINTEDAFIRAYEQRSVAFTLHKLLGNEQELSASLLAEILGLPKNEKELAYCQSLFDALNKKKKLLNGVAKNA